MRPEPSWQTVQLAVVVQAEAAGELTKLNETDNIMRGNLSAQSDPSKEFGRVNLASVAMRTSFSDAGRIKRVEAEQEHALITREDVRGRHGYVWYTCPRSPWPNLGKSAGRICALYSIQVTTFWG